jgi:flagellin-like protein
MDCRKFDNDSGISPVIGIILIIAITLVLSVVVYATVSAYEVKDPVFANIEIESVDLFNHQEVVLVHKGGDSIDVSDISIMISVNGETLKNNLINLPVTGTPYGFTHALGGVFWGTPGNQSHDNIWDPGDKGDFNIATGNNTVLHSGDQLKVTIVHSPTNTIISSPERRI